MKARVYIVLDITDGKSEQVVQTLRSKQGVVMADALEGLPNVIMVIEAAKRFKLAELTNDALASVEMMTDGMRLLPARNGMNSSVCVKARSNGHNGHNR